MHTKILFVFRFTEDTRVLLEAWASNQVDSGLYQVSLWWFIQTDLQRDWEQFYFIVFTLYWEWDQERETLRLLKQCTFVWTRKGAASWPWFWSQCRDSTFLSKKSTLFKVQCLLNMLNFKNLGSDDGTVKFWEVSTGRCMKTLKLGGVVKCVTWNPNASFSLVAAVVWVNNRHLSSLWRNYLLIHLPSNFPK